MNIVSAVANIQKELDYYKESFEDCRGIIKQLTQGPGEIEYIHPMDLGELLNKFTVNIDLFTYNTDDGQIVEIAKTGKKYKQSLFMPRK